MIRAAIIVLSITWASLAHAGDDPDTPEGKTHFAEGSAAFKRGDFAAASKAFATGYAIEPWSGFLFAWAQSERSAGSCTAAIDLYKQFIATKPPTDARDHAIGWIKECGGTYVEPVPDGEPKPPVADPDPDPDPPPVKPLVEPLSPAPSRFEHKLAITLGGLGLASGLVSVRFYLWSRSDLAVADRTIRYAEAEHAYERGTTRRTIAQVSGGLAVALVAAGVVRFVLHPREHVDVAVTPTSVTLAGRF